MFFVFICLNAYSQSRPIITVVHDDGYDAVNTVEFSPDGSRFLTGTVNAHIWDSMTGEKLLTIQNEMFGVSSAAFSRDGTKIVTGTSALLFNLWDSKTGALIKEFKGLSSPEGPTVYTAITFTPDGQKVITGDMDGDLVMWDIATGNSEQIGDIGGVVRTL